MVFILNIDKMIRVYWCGFVIYFLFEVWLYFLYKVFVVYQEDVLKLLWWWLSVQWQVSGGILVLFIGGGKIFMVICFFIEGLLFRGYKVIWLVYIYYLFDQVFGGFGLDVVGCYEIGYVGGEQQWFILWIVLGIFGYGKVVEIKCIDDVFIIML